jgi:thiol:disulfide interchange protein DsbC
MNRVSSWLLGCVAFGLSLSGMAADTAATSALKPELRAKLASKIPGAKPENIRETPIPGLYEVSVDTSIGYISADGRYVISGDLFEIASRTNLSDVRKADTRRALLAGVKEDQMIVFAPANVKHTITVFTDVDCTYCRKLHSEIGELNKLGVKVRYLAYPRTGPNTESWAKMEQVFCSKDRKQALTSAKMGEPVKGPACGSTPVASEYALGEQIGVNGTPAIITDKGEYIGGYLPAAKLVQYLDSGQRPGL